MEKDRWTKTEKKMESLAQECVSSTQRQTTLPLQSACWLYQQFAARHAERKPDIVRRHAEEECGPSWIFMRGAIARMISLSPVAQTVEELKALMIAQAAKFASRVSQNKETIAELGGGSRLSAFLFAKRKV